MTRDDNPAGAVSVVQAFRFIGASAAPIAFTPVYHLSPALGFLLPAVLLAVIPPVAMMSRAPAKVKP